MDFLGELVGDIIGDSIGDKIGKRLRRGAERGGRCALRIVTGSQDGLSKQWRLRSAEFGPGQILVSQRGGVQAIMVTSAQDTGGQVRLPTLGDCGIARLSTPAATLELALPADQLASVISLITESPAAQGWSADGPGWSADGQG